MNTEKHKGQKVGPIKDILNKCKYSSQGLIYCYKNETSFIFETIAIVLAIIFGLIFQITVTEWFFSLISIFLIMEIEFLNTSIEAVVDMCTHEFNPLAKAAKDCGSAATGLASIVAAIVNAVIFIPYIWALIC